MNKQHLGIAAIVFVLMGAAAAVASYATRASLEAPEKIVASKAEASPTRKTQEQKVVVAQQPASPQPACDDRNVVGTVAGGTAGALLGSQIGKGSGKTVAVLGGLAGGALLGNKYIPTRNVTCD